MGDCLRDGRAVSYSLMRHRGLPPDEPGARSSPCFGRAERRASVTDAIIKFTQQHENWIYLVLVVWTFLEGETIVIFAGAWAVDGTPWLPLVILCAFAGSLCSDQLMFFLGWYRGRQFIASRPAMN